MNPDPRYTLPLEFDTDGALNIYRKRLIKILIWGGCGIGGIVLILLLSAILGQGGIGMPFLPLLIECLVFFLMSGVLAPKPQKSKKSLFWVPFGIVIALVLLRQDITPIPLILMVLAFFLISESSETKSEDSEDSEEENVNKQLGRES